VTTDSSRFDPFPYPLHFVVGVLADQAELNSGRDGLGKAGFDDDRVVVLHGEEDAERLDIEGQMHGVRGRLVRALQSIADVDLAHIRRHGEYMRADRYVVGVVVGDDRQDQQRAVEALRAAGGEFINFYGDSYVESFDDR
jgi:hypothetical protein